MKTVFLFFILVAPFVSEAQIVARLQITEPIEGLCDPDNVYALFPGFTGQTEAVSEVSEDELLERLNAIDFLKEHPKHTDKGMMSLIINCEGEVVQCKMDNLTKSKELDTQIEAVFNTLGPWKPGQLKSEDVDSNLLYSFKIKKGRFTFD